MWGTSRVTLRMKLPIRLPVAARRFAADASGTTAMEYTLLVALIAVVIAVAVGQVGDG